MILRSLIAGVALAVTLSAGATDLRAADLARPCGPDSLTGPLRRLVPQGVGGADFRPACVRHDACYDTLGSHKAACDRRYRREMISTCRHSRHPVLCRFTANMMFIATAVGGRKAFDSAQRIAAGLATPNR